MASARNFDVRQLTGFTTIAVICFLALYTPILTLVIYSFNAGTSIAIWAATVEPAPPRSE